MPGKSSKGRWKTCHRCSSRRVRDDGRAVSFRHDEIRDFHDNIRLDYGYATTIASAQGITVDRAFLLIDDRPSRETVYPAATRHREGIDVYVNRAPIVFDIAEHRPEDEADMPVTDIDVRAYLAERWSRSQPKEAALDYIADGAWRDTERTSSARGHGMKRRSGAAALGTRRSQPRSAARGGPGEQQGESGGGPRGGRRAAHAAEARVSATLSQTQAAANDNAIVRIAREIRHAVSGWRHGAAVDALRGGEASRGDGGVGRAARARTAAEGEGGGAQPGNSARPSTATAR